MNNQCFVNIISFTLDQTLLTKFPYFRMSKNKQIYGVWADNSDSDGDEAPSIGE